MKYTQVFASASLVATTLAATVPSEPWTTLTPTATMSGATTDYTNSFGIEIVTITSGTTASASVVAKRDVINQIGDGQIQEQTSESLVYVTPTPTTVAVVNQIGDGQIQHQSATTAASTVPVVNQIGDGQIQHQSATTATAAVSQISDGQVQESGAPSSDDTAAVACLTEDSLAMVLKGSVLTDAKGRIGAIVANRQFQFDGPPPQAGSIYAAGWSITSDKNLAIGDNEVFYQCKSGDFYNLYDEDVAAQCSPVYLSIVDFVSC